MSTAATQNQNLSKYAMSLKSKPLIVVLGLGEMGIIHAENLAKLRTIRLGLACTRPDVLTKQGSRLHADQLYPSYADALGDIDVCAVVIATSVASHPDVISMCARAGKHIFSEKPLGTSSDAISRCLEAVREANIRFMVGFQRRWDEAFAVAKKRVDSGELGSPIVLKCTSGDPEYPEKYHRNTQKNSILLDLAVHDIDMARWMTDSEVDKVYAVADALTYPNLKEMGDNDVCVAILEMRNRAKVMLHLSRALAYGYNVTAEFNGTKGTLKIGDLKKHDIVQIADSARVTDIQWHFGDRFKQAFQSEMEAFAKLVCANDNEVCKVLEDKRYGKADDGKRATIVAEAMVRSVESGTFEKVIYD